MTRVNVVDPDSTDPNALARGRDTSLGRDATRTESAALPPPAPAPAPLLEPSVPPPIDGELNSTPIPDSDALKVDINPLLPRVYPNIPANIIAPVPLDLSNTMGDQDSINRILRESGSLALQDEITLNRGLQSLLNAGVPFGPNEPIYQPPDISIPDFPYPQLIEDAIEYRSSQAASRMSPVGVNPGTGGVVPGVRNALSGNPMSQPVREGLGAAAFGDIGTEFEQSLPDNPLFRNPLSIVRFGLAARDVIAGFGEAFGTNQYKRFAARFDPLGIGPEIAPPIQATANLDAIGFRALDALPEQLTGGIDARAVDMGEQSFMQALVSNSLVSRDILSGLATSPESATFAPLQGRFGDFGNAGLLSGLLYLANVPEGLASGGLYQLTNFYVDNFTDLELGRDRVRLFDAFRGRDLGFMQEADDARYLSFIGDTGLLSRIGIRNRILQGTAGFVTDVLWGTVFDFEIAGRAARLATRNVLDPAVARALPDATPAINRILNQDVGSSVVNLNRVIDDAIQARRLDPLPRVAPPDVRRIIVNADNIELPVRPSNISRLTREIFVTQPRNILDNIRFNRLSEVDVELANLQESIIRNNLSADEARQALNQINEIPLESTLTPDIIDTQLAVIRNSTEVNEATQRQINNLLVERRLLRQTSGNLRQVIAQEINESVARGATRIRGNVLTTIAPDPAFDTLIPVVPQVSIQPSLPASTTLRQYRVDPNSVNPVQLVPVRRNNEQLTNLAKFHNLINNQAPTLNPQQLLTLRSDHPTLLARYGNPIDDNLSLPVKRLEVTPPNPITLQRQETIIPDVPSPRVGEIELSPLSHRTLNSLSNRHARLLERIQQAPDVPTQDRLLRQLDMVERRINTVISQSIPRDVEDFYIDSLPTSRTPLSPTTQDLARQVSRAESQFRESTKSARDLQQQLLDASRVLDEQGSFLEELPQVERTSLHNEIATRNNYTPGGVPLIAPAQQTLDIEATTVIDDVIPPVTSPPRSLEDHISSGRQWYHGTKSRIDDLSTVNYTRGSSVSNELGPGLYLTTDPELAQVFAKAHPATDRVPNPSLRQTDVGVVHQVLALPDNRRIINADEVLPNDSPIRNLFHELVRSQLGSSLSPDLTDRLLANARRITRTKPYRDWFQSLRNNWNRLQPDSQSTLVTFNSLFVQRLASEFDIYGASHRHVDGHFTLAVYNRLDDSPLSISFLNKTRIGTGSLEEQRLGRYAADLFAHNEFNNITTRSNLAASALAVDQQVVNNLRQATKEAYEQSLRDTEDLLRLDTELQNQVRLEQSRRISDIQRRGPDSASTQLRRFRGDNNSPCL